jgi:hypothetical protein
VRTPRVATSNVAIGLTRSTPSIGRESVDDLLVERDGPDRGQQLVAGMTSSSQALAARRGVAGDAADRHDHREPRRQRPDGQRRRLRSRASAARASRSSSRNSQRNGSRRRGRSRRAGTARAGRRRAAAVDRDRRRNPEPTASCGQARQPGEADRDEHADQPAEPGASRRTPDRAGLERLDRRDRAGPPRGLDRRGERDDEPDRERDQDRAA